ncbi:Acyl-CoA N-acyltransferase [Cordyceps fumosorosea ARSEF 2679]|uniref:Acyl-CoA N-acyltransferase n=1 Tax=Cordyceps fumosorosea (strain ARSEF 2679) TaxID=1081104 RepID=A0A167TL14_CORFA|nr:Acyl-CoA N-acyltransferase [Cordyceps fumosorosea ARSEF 2679]OAA60709.1 Acyl-CoA N-acyltransferase [Cordyceps fumosorosea ARSEF 2679]
MIEIRKATLAEVADIIRIGRGVFALTFGHSVPDSELQAYLDSAYTEPLISAELQDATKDIFVAVDRPDSDKRTSPDSDESSTADSPAVVGFAQLTRGTSVAEPCVARLPQASSSAELQRLYVAASHHGQGIGRRLAAAAEDVARDEGFTHMWLGVWEENGAAARVYAKLGYSGIGFHDFAVGSVVQRDDILMKRL